MLYFWLVVCENLGFWRELLVSLSFGSELIVVVIFLCSVGYLRLYCGMVFG